MQQWFSHYSVRQNNWFTCKYPCTYRLGSVCANGYHLPTCYICVLSFCFCHCSLVAHHPILQRIQLSFFCEQVCKIYLGNTVVIERPSFPFSCIDHYSFVFWRAGNCRAGAWFACLSHDHLIGPLAQVGVMVLGIASFACDETRKIDQLPRELKVNYMELWSGSNVSYTYSLWSHMRENHKQELAKGRRCCWLDLVLFTKLRIVFKHLW